MPKRNIQEEISLNHFRYLNDTLQCKLSIVQNEIRIFDLPDWFNEDGHTLTCNKKYFEANKDHPKLKFVSRDEILQAIQKRIKHDGEWLEELRVYHDEQLAQYPGYEPEDLKTIRDKYGLTHDYANESMKSSWDYYEDRLKKLEDTEKILALLKDPKTREDTLYRLRPRFTSASSNDRDLYQEAVSLIARTQIASTSFLQHHLNIGYAKASMLMKRLEDEGLVGKADGIHKREIFIDRDSAKQQGGSDE